MEFKDEKLTERHRLIFWLCQLWERVETHPGDTTPEIPYIYDELLKRYVRDYNKPERCGVEGTQAEAVAKWRNWSLDITKTRLHYVASMQVSTSVSPLKDWRRVDFSLQGKRRVLYQHYGTVLDTAKVES